MLNPFYPIIIRKWINLPQEIKDSGSFASFKYQLNRHTEASTTKCFFYTSPCKNKNLHVARIILIFIAKIYRVPCPFCGCGRFKSAYHICPNYSITRGRCLEANRRNHTTHELLFGKGRSTNKENEEIFL